MSNSQAVAAVTVTLRELLFVGVNADAGVAVADVSTKPPDKARGDNLGNQLNLFLYQTTIDAALRNADLPGVAPGDSGHPPLPLVLRYLVTAYGENDDDTVAHRLLGRAMNVLHDHPLLGREEIEAAVRVPLPDSDLHRQVERVRLTPVQLTIDEVSKLWTSFQTQYRISAAYEASVVLIQSRRPTQTPLPVLSRNIVVQAGTVPPFPTLEAIRLPGLQPSARLGDPLTLVGHHLAGTTAVRLSHPRRPVPLTVPPPPLATVTDAAVEFVLPDLAADVPAGTWTVAAVLGAPDKLTGELPLRVAPLITAGLPVTLTRDGDGGVVVDLECSPLVLPDQSAFLLLSERQVAAEPREEPTGSLRFQVAAAEAGEHLVRLRVDGVDSHLVDWAATLPVFDTSQKVTIQ
jgi:hypothetical protein